MYGIYVIMYGFLTYIQLSVQTGIVHQEGHVTLVPQAQLARKFCLLYALYYVHYHDYISSTGVHQLTLEQDVKLETVGEPED